MIPKVIHYCWFGRGEKSRLIKKCIKSWKKHCPDYEIIEWNEDNFDINSTLWTKQAYEAKKWAFVSDYVRLWVLQNYGGIYMDTDVELIKPIDIFLNNEAFSGFEYIDTIKVQTGIIAAEKQNRVIEMWLGFYDNRPYLIDGKPCMEPNVIYISNMMEQNGLIINNEYQCVYGMAFYPNWYFCPRMHTDKTKEKKKNMYAIHHFDSSWRSEKGRRDFKRKRRHATKWYRIYEQIAAYPIAAYKKIFK